MVFVMFTVGVGLSPLDVAVAARATEAGSPASAGYVLAALAVGSAMGGLIWGRLRHHHHYRGQLLALLAWLAVGTAAAGLTPTLPALGAVLALTGMCVAPVFVVAYLPADLLTAQSARIEATTWVATASNLGGALGAAGAGYLVQGTSAQTALLFAGGAMAVTAVALWAMNTTSQVASRAELPPRQPLDNPAHRGDERHGVRWGMGIRTW